MSGRGAQPRQVAVLAVLAWAGHSGITRDKLVALLWPEVMDSTARHMLRDSVYLLRKALDGKGIDTGGGLLRLSDDLVWNDVGAFREAVAAGDLEEAATLYRGPFLDGFFLKNGSEFAEWVESTRRALARQHEEVLESLAQTAMAAGDPTAAVRWWRRLATLDPFNTRFTVEWMEALVANGEPGNALLVAQEHEEFLRRELGVPLPQELHAARAALQEGTTGTLQSPDPATSGEDHRIHQAAPDSQAVGPEVKEGLFRRRMGWAAAALAAALVSFWGVQVLRSGGAELRPTLVAVVPLENRSGDPALDDLGTVASDLIVHGIRQASLSDVVPAPATEAFWEDLALDPRGRDPVLSLAERTGAGLVVHGSFYLLGDSIRFQAQITDAIRRSAGVPVDAVVGPMDDPMSVVGALGERVLGALAVSLHPVGTLRPGFFSSPPSLAAYRAWRDGEEEVDRGDWAKAQIHFQRAWSLDSTFFAPLVRIGWAHFVLGSRDGIDSVVSVARQHEAELSAHEGFQIAWLESYLEGDLQEQARAGARLGELTPLDWSVSAGCSALRAGLLEDAIRFLEQLDLPALPDHWHILSLMYLGRARHLQGNLEAEAEAALAAREAYPASLPSFEAEVRVLLTQGRIAEAEALVAGQLIPPGPYLSFPPASATWSTAGAVLTYLALEARAHGQMGAYRTWVDRAVAWHRNHLAEGTTIDPMAMVQALYYAERWDEARDELRGLIAGGATLPEVEVLGFRAVLALRLADTDEAVNLDEELAGLEALPIAGENLLWRARIAALTGDRQRAMNLLWEAERNGWPYNIWHHVELDFESLQDFGPFQRFLAGRG